MKKSIIIIGIATLLSSCGVSELEKLQAEKADLESTINSSTARLSEVKEEISKLSEDEETDYPDVTVVKTTQETFEHFIKIQGVVEAGEMVMVTPEVGGVISSLNVKEGQRVTKGTVLATFDSKDISSSKAEINTQLDVAIKLRDKQQKLYDQGLGNILQLDQAKGQVASLEQALKSLSVQGGKFKVEAPFTGVVEKVYVVKGQVAGPASPLVMLVGEGERKVVAKISETYLKNLETGAQVSVEFPILGQVIDSLSVTRLGGFVDPVNRTIDLEVNLLNKFNVDKHVPNLTANIKVRDNVIPNALLVPSKVILKGAEQSSHVFVLTASTENSNDSVTRYEVSKKVIQIGDMYEGKTIVTSGLNAGEIVIDRGRADVNEGNIVEIADF